MWKLVERPQKIAGIFEVSDDGRIRYAEDKSPKAVYTDTRGYKVITYSHKHTEYKLHRLIADAFIAPVKGKEVHHINGDRSDNNVSNLMVCTKKEHRREHATVDHIVPVSGLTKHGDIILTERKVHEVCQLLELGLSYPQIRDQLNLYDVTDDCIGKIASGKNWPNISCQYNIHCDRRECMNSYSDKAFEIGLLMSNGYSTKQIGEIFDYDVSTNKSYQRLFKAAKRYANQYESGKWGFLSDEEENKIIDKLTANI